VLDPVTVTDPATQTISSAASPAYTLKVGSTNYAITPATNTLNDLADAINGTTGADVTATVVDVGTGGAHDYRLSLQSTQTGTGPIQLNDGSRDLQTPQSGGDYAASVTSSPLPPKVTSPSTQSISGLASPAFTLTVGPDGKTTTYAITPASNTLTALMNAINSTAGANVQASIVDVGSSGAHDYRLQLASTKLGDIGVQLNDGSMDLETQQARGQLATYKVDGMPESSSDSRSVSLAPGVTVALLSKSPAGVATNITVTRASQPISDALNGFATAYNAAVDELDSQRGLSSGALAGQAVVYDLSSALQSITGCFSGGTGVNSLAAIGLTLDNTGHMTYSPMSFLGAQFYDSQGVASFLGGATSGGFLKQAADALNGVEDPLYGTLQTTISSVTSDTNNINQQIADEQDRVNQLQTNLTTQMSAADAAIASMEQQYNYMSALFQSMMTAAQQQYK
jgi:flagellar capping protein FliD